MAVLTSAVMLAACQPQEQTRDQEVEAVSPAPSPTPITTPTSAPEAPNDPADETSHRAAVRLAARYHSLIATGDYPAAYRLWGDDGLASGMSEAEFARSFADYASYRAAVGEPGRMEGACGSLYIDVPVTITGWRRDGAPFRLEGKMTLRRSNDIPGATPDQLRWSIAGAELAEQGQR